MVELEEGVIYFLVGIKKFWISVYILKTPFFTKSVLNNFDETLRQIFLELQQVSLRAL